MCSRITNTSKAENRLREKNRLKNERPDGNLSNNYFLMFITVLDFEHNYISRVFFFMSKHNYSNFTSTPWTQKKGVRDCKTGCIFSSNKSFQVNETLRSLLEEHNYTGMLICFVVKQNFLNYCVEKKTALASPI